MGDLPDPASPDAMAPDEFDLSVEAAVPAGPQSAAPNMIGDTLGFGGCGALVIGDGFSSTSTIPVCPGGGRKFRAATNQSPLPQQRVFYNFHHFNAAFDVAGPNRVASVNVRRHEVGLEMLLHGIASLQVQVPFSDSIDSRLVGFDFSNSNTLPHSKDTEIGNVSLAVKSLLYQDACQTLSVGLGIDIPTAEDVVIQDLNPNDAVFNLDNETVTLSPFLGWLYQPSCHWFGQGFVQFALPLSRNSYEYAEFDSSQGEFVGSRGEWNEVSLLHVDLGVGYYLYDGSWGSCTSWCDSSVAGMVELHYTTTLDDEGAVAIGPDDSFIFEQYDIFNLTVGLAAAHGGWSVTPAMVVPLREPPNRSFDLEWVLQINRAF